MAVATEEQYKSMETTVHKLATIMRDMAQHVYKNDEEDDDDSEDMDVEKMPMFREDEMVTEEEEIFEEPVMDKMPMEEDPMESDPLLEDMDKGGMYKDDGMMAEDEMNLDEELEMMRHEYKMAKNRRDKGYNNASKTNADEEDTSFGESPDSDIKGNEAQPAGMQGGDPMDETFNAKFSQMVSDVATLKKYFAGQAKKQRAGVRSKAPNPGLPNVNKGRTTEESQQSLIDMEKLTKDRSYKQINQLRMDVGDLPRSII